MPNLNFAVSVAGLLLLTVAPSTKLAYAADESVPAVKAPKAQQKPADLPFFFFVDNRVTFSWMPDGTTPGSFSRNPDGSYNGKTARQAYSFTHFDAWAYGTNFFTISLFKSGHNGPAAPCVAPGVTITGGTADCAGLTEVYGLFRSTIGFNELFDTKAFAIGPLRNVSFEVGADTDVNNQILAVSKHGFVGGLQFQFELPYKGYFNVAPMVYKDFSHNGYTTCGLFPGGVTNVTCTLDGNNEYNPTWAIETNYYMDLGFLPESIQFFSLSGRAAWYGPKGNQNAPLGPAAGGTATATELVSEPIRLTFDLGKAAWGPKYSHNVDVWVAYRYWQNEFGLDHKAAPGVCTVAGVSTNSCTESTIYTGITAKF